MPAAPRPPKICARCGRAITHRKRFAATWDHVRHCSAACRSARLTPRDHALETAIRTLLAARARGATLCPSDAARAVGGDDWRDLIEPARQAARRLVAAGHIVITQGGHIVDPSTAKGPIRLRLR